MLAHTKPGPRYQPLLQLLRTAETIWNVSRQFFDRWELSPSQFNILNLLKGSNQGITQVDLSRELIMHRSNVTGLIDRLEKRKLVARRATPTDRRAWSVVLTRQGEDLLEQILPEYYRLAESVWGEIPPAEAAKLAEQLSALSNHTTELFHENS
jgi:DNA-binding MarR family transcriptional regulator